MKTKVFKIKKSLLFLSFIVFNSFSFAQDTLHFRNGNQVVVKVTEITSQLIKYKKIEHLDGPTYSDLKNDIFFIIFNNGTKEVFQYEEPIQPIVIKVENTYLQPKKYPKLTPFGATKFTYDGSIIGNKEMHTVLLNLNDPKISKHIKLAQRQANGQYIGFAFFPCAIAAMYMASESSVSPTLNYFDDEIAGATIMGVLGLACFTTSVTLKVKRTKNEAAALKLYQQNY